MGYSAVIYGSVYRMRVVLEQIGNFELLCAEIGMLLGAGEGVLLQAEIGKCQRI